MKTAAVVVVAAGVWIGATANLRGDPSETPFLVGGDISALPVLEHAGAQYCVRGEPGDCIQILADCGWNCFRLRIFVKPTGRNVVVQDLPFTIALAKRIKATGAKLLLDFHYSDTWADPGHQTKPAAWESLDAGGLEKAVYEHTKDCLSQMKAAGVLPDFVQIGNEITPGMLWPDGKLWGVGEPDGQWQKLGRLLKAGVRGVRDAAGEHPVQVVLHVDCGGNPDKTKWFFEKVERQAVPYDVIGLSFYPWWHGRLSDLQANIKASAEAFGKDLFIVEAAYPYRPVTFGDKYAHADHVRFPCSPEGQAEYTKELIRTVNRVPSAHVIGIQWWYPESIAVPKIHSWFGGAMAVFDQQGELLPAARILGKAAGESPLKSLNVTGK